MYLLHSNYLLSKQVRMATLNSLTLYWGSAKMQSGDESHLNNYDIWYTAVFEQYLTYICLVLVGFFYKLSDAILQNIRLQLDLSRVNSSHSIIYYSVVNSWNIATVMYKAPV